MADSLPLIPDKDGICAEVRPLLRMVFRELDFLPPLASEEQPPSLLPPEKIGVTVNDEPLPAVNRWTEKFKTECDQIWNREGEIKHQHAQRLAREPLPNIYKLHPPQCPGRQVPKWRLDRGLIDRGDLVPAIEQDAGRDGTLWIKNILNISSGNVRELEVAGRHISAPKLHMYDENTIQTFSIGQEIPNPPLNMPQPVPQPLRPDCVLCVPPQLDFVNFVIGHVHTQSIRLINVSKDECRLAVVPPKCRELTVEICALRGLSVTSGAAAKLKIHFKPVHVRALHDELPVRVSCGQTITVPIACYMQPPILDVVVPNVTPSLLFCTPDEVPSSTLSQQLIGGPDVVELGAQLLGNAHYARVLLHCDSEHTTFFVLTEDAWISYNLDCLTTSGSVVSGPFSLWPAWWCGGGVISASVWCRGDDVGTHVAQLRILSSTAINRQMYLLADVVHFKPNHLILEAQPKDYDICSEDDPDCEYYVNVGSAFPHRSLTATVKLFNTSPIIYSYYWTTRPWGMCWCWQEEQGSQSHVGEEADIEDLCPGAIEALNLLKKDPEAYEQKNENAKLVNIDPGRSQILPRTSCTLQVRLPDVGGKLGVQRAVLMLILKDVPRESFPPDYEPAIISTRELDTVKIPGIPSESSTREVCEVLVTQMEVWWEVVPLRFVLEPAVLNLPYSRRLTEISFNISAWQLFGWNESCAEWETPERVRQPPPLRLTPEHSANTTIQLPLPVLPNHYPETDIFTMVAPNNEWRASCAVRRACSTRHPALRPARAWLGVVPPATHLQCIFSVTNDTYQQICYWCEGFRWIGENQPADACKGEIPCEFCQEYTCTCGFLKPSRGALAVDATAEICYDVNAPKRDGCVVTLVQVRRCEPDLGQVHSSPATEARASVVAYRVLAPRVIMRVLPCFAGNPECETGCGLDPGHLGSKYGTAILRPSSALVIGRRTCYRLCITNITPLPTAVSFDKPIDNTDLVNVKFIPNNFSVRSYGKKEIRVVLEARKVCARRVFVYRARVMRAHQPIYLLVDTAVTGLQISCQVPIGGGPHTDEFVIMRRSQRQETAGKGAALAEPSEGSDTANPSEPAELAPPTTPEELFLEEDRKREVIKENLCSCRFEMLYIPPVKRPEPPIPYEEMEYPRVELVTTPPALTRVCACCGWTKPYIPEAPESIALEFIMIPLREVCERRLVVRNESVVTARFTCAVRRWPRVHKRTLDKDQWANDVGPAGIVVSCSPASGVLAAHSREDLLVQVYADCWGLYWDQILIQVDNLEPIVLDVWVHAVGPALQIKLQPNFAAEDLPTVWLSTSDPVRSVFVRNVSRSDLLVHTYVMHENEHVQDALPFRLYLRFTDVPAITCPCYSTDNSDSSEPTEEEIVEEMDTGIDLYLASDHGPQCDFFYQASPAECSVEAGATGEWRVSLKPPPYCETAPDAVLLLRLTPLDRDGDHWYREDPEPQMVRLRQAPRQHHLKLSCDEIVVKICALDLPFGDFLRVRKHFFMQNLGNGILDVNVYTSVPWCVVHRCGAGCSCLEASEQRMTLVMMRLPPWSSTDMCVEVCISTMEAWPHAGPAPHAPLARPQYEPRRRDTTPLRIYDDYQVLMTLPLTLEIEYPVIQTEPTTIDFGYVTDGDSRKTYVTVSHSSRTETIILETQWIGCKEFEIWPPSLEIPPGCSERFYIQYTAVLRHGFSEGYAHVCVCSAAGRRLPAARWPAWCRAAVTVRAAPARDHKCRTDVRDHTDDTHLLPPCAADLQP